MLRQSNSLLTSKAICPYKGRNACVTWAGCVLQLFIGSTKENPLYIDIVEVGLTHGTAQKEQHAADSDAHIVAHKATSRKASFSWTPPLHDLPFELIAKELIWRLLHAIGMPLHYETAMLENCLCRVVVVLTNIRIEHHE